jgi:hypothetical protein
MSRFGGLAGRLVPSMYRPAKASPLCCYPVKWLDSWLVAASGHRIAGGYLAVA